jgi:hypothetical protein
VARVVAWIDGNAERKELGSDRIDLGAVFPAVFWRKACGRKRRVFDVNNPRHGRNTLEEILRYYDEKLYSPQSVCDQMEFNNCEMITLRYPRTAAQKRLVQELSIFISLRREQEEINVHQEMRGS